MRKIITLLFFGALLVNCSGDSNDDDVFKNNSEIIEEVVEEAAEEEVMEGYQPIALKGDFVSAAHPTSGMVSINAENTELTFKNFKTDAGPKLLVYLTNDLEASEYVNLGDLKGIVGDYSYSVPEGTDLSKFKYVNIWCVDFSVGFGHAELKSE